MLVSNLLTVLLSNLKYLCSRSGVRVPKLDSATTSSSTSSDFCSRSESGLLLLLYGIHLHNKRPAHRQRTSSRDDSQSQIVSHALPFLNNRDRYAHLSVYQAGIVDGFIDLDGCDWVLVEEVKSIITIITYFFQPLGAIPGSKGSCKGPADCGESWLLLTQHNLVILSEYF